ncbi:MAG TPA: DUF1553 domain-containing protein, partial [Candidatus Dormibacteraeota bacterium]|nr:DUF1553 domain-containing protein [Candidatus Dormibacteraeota bacterium]
MSVPSPKSPVVSGLACLGIIFLSATLLCAVTPFETQAPPNCANGIDEIVFAKLRALKIEPANVCSDSVFVRRVHLDVTGTLPTAHEAQEFILSRDPKKRSVLIDRLLGQDEYADYWAMKWSDLLRVKAEFPINLWPNAAQAYHHWIRDSVRQNKPYDQFARELLTSTGSNFREPPANFYRAMQNREPSGVVQAVALTFMGVRVDKWSSEQLSKMAIFFTKIGYKYTSEWKEEIVFFDPEKTNSPVVANGYEGILPDKSKIFLRADADPRQAFADWLITPQNPWFTRNIANRMWFWLLGRGIIQEPDDIRSDNPPSNQELLRFLENQLVEAKYDLKGFCRLILNSQTYQLSSVRTTDSPQAEANFAFYPVRRLEAEVLIDAVDDITGSTEKYSSPIPEPFTFIPENQRSIALADGSISSAFLELFGRPPRDTGLAFERNNRPSAAQELHLLNSTH